MQKSNSLLIYDNSDHNSDLYYLTRFLAHDAFIYLRHKGLSYLLVSELEFSRAVSQSSVDNVYLWTKYRNLAKKRLGLNNPESEKKVSAADVMAELLIELGIQHLWVPEKFPLYYGDLLRKKGFSLSIKKEPLIKERAIKSELEIANIRQAQSQNESVMQNLIDILAASSIEGDFLVYQKEKLTSDFLKKIYAQKMLDNDYTVSESIIACGKQTAMPHHTGNGYLYAHQPIILDLFPRNNKTRYWGDMTRSFVKGKASPDIKKMWQAVYDGQMMIIDKLRSGSDSVQLHQELIAFFENQGFATNTSPENVCGFIHGTGHGIGLDIHESPSFSRNGGLFESGMVVTVEPGLYYPNLGGIRIEDIVVIRDDHGENLNTLEKFLIIP